MSDPKLGNLIKKGNLCINFNHIRQKMMSGWGSEWGESGVVSGVVSGVRVGW